MGDFQKWMDEISKSGSGSLSMPEFGSQFGQAPKAPSLGVGTDSASFSGNELAGAGIGAAATLATGLMKAQAMTEKANKEVEREKLSSTAAGNIKAGSEQMAGMTGPLSGLIASYRAAIK